MITVQRVDENTRPYDKDDKVKKPLFLQCGAENADQVQHFEPDGSNKNCSYCKSDITTGHTHIDNDFPVNARHQC